MILQEHSLIVSKELDFTFEEMISLEIALINKGRLLPSHKLDYDLEGNIRVYYGSQNNFINDIYSQDEEEEIIETFLTAYEHAEEDCQSIQSIPQNLMDTVMTGQDLQASNTPVYNNPGQAVPSAAQPSTSHIRIHTIYFVI